MNSPPSSDARVVRVVQLFEQLSPADLPRMSAFYTANARFKDPFNEVEGVPAITRVFEHMYRVLETPRFVVLDVVAEGDQFVRGATHLRFAADGRTAVHRDFWDAAEERYEKLPLAGTLMRWLKHRASR